LIGLLAAVLALCGLAFAAGAPVAAAAAPTLSNPGNQTSVAGSAITPLVIEGTEIESVVSEGLPAGLEAKVLSPTQVEISGTPTTPEVTTVTLHAKNAEGESEAVVFKWTVLEPAPAITTPENQTSVAGTAITPLTITGERMNEVTAENLPSGLSIERISD